MSLSLIPAILLLLLLAGDSRAKSLDIPVRGAGISFGNSEEFDGLRFNLRDREVRRLRGLNVTFWRAEESEEARVHGVSLGMMPQAGVLNGLHLGVGAVAAEKRLAGIAAGGLGAAVGEDLRGIAFGGLGVGVGEDARGIVAGGLGAGVGGNLTGIAAGGVGLGCGGTARGLLAGGIGVGVRKVNGVMIGGLVTASDAVSGAALSGGVVHIQADGALTGLSASPFNRVQGRMTGVSVGILNYARTLRGVQLGVVNIVRENRAPFRVLPLINLRLS